MTFPLLSFFPPRRYACCFGSLSSPPHSSFARSQVFHHVLFRYVVCSLDPHIFTYGSLDRHTIVYPTGSVGFNESRT